jgi:predicted TIM-barrel fold metal-dependent hydrolase
MKSSRLGSTTVGASRAPSRRAALVRLAAAGGALATVLVWALHGGGARTPGASGSPPAARSAAPGPARRFRHKVDAHVHAALGCGPELADLMDRYGFDHVVDLSGGAGGRLLAAHLAQAASMPGRITVFATLAYALAQEPGYGPRMAALVEAAHGAGAKGLKIAKALGLGMRRSDGSLVPVDDPELDVVFETAGRLGMPVAIHTADPKAFWKPVGPDNERSAELSVHPGWGYHDAPVPSFEELLDQFERRVARHPHTTFIGVHFGNDAEDPDRVERMLRDHPNLYVDLAARIPELGRHPARRMHDLLVRWQDRVLYGTDLGVGPPGEPLMLGSTGATPPTDADRDLFFGATTRWLETADRAFPHPTPIQGAWTIDGVDLPPEVLEKIYWKNAARVIGIELD